MGHVPSITHHAHAQQGDPPWDLWKHFSAVLRAVRSQWMDSMKQDRIRAWWHMPGIPASGRPEQVNCREFQASLGYRVKPYLKYRKTKPGTTDIHF